MFTQRWILKILQKKKPLFVIDLSYNFLEVIQDPVKKLFKKIDSGNYYGKSCFLTTCCLNYLYWTPHIEDEFFYFETSKYLKKYASYEKNAYNKNFLFSRGKRFLRKNTHSLWVQLSTLVLKKAKIYLKSI